MGLDAVEIVMGWEESFGISISDDEAMTLPTPNLAIDLVAQKLDAGMSRNVRALAFVLLTGWVFRRLYIFELAVVLGILRSNRYANKERSFKRPTHTGAS